MPLHGHLRTWLYPIGLLLMLGVFLAEVIFQISGTSAYVLLVLVTLALSKTSLMASAGGLVGTMLLISGIIFGVHDHTQVTNLSNYWNDAIAIITIWISVLFTIRYKESVRNEARQREMVNSLFLNATEAIIIVNESGNITMANPGTHKMFGYSNDELIDSNIDMLVPEHFRVNHRALREEYMKDPVSRPMTSGMELFGRHKNGRSIPVELSLSAFELDGKTFVVAFVLDITDRKRAELDLRTLNAELEDRIGNRTEELSRSLRNLEELNTSLKEEVKHRIQTERSLRNSQRLYTAMAGSFPDGWIGILDSEFTYLFANGRGISGSRIKPSELVGMSFTGTIKSESASRELQKCLDSDKTIAFEIECETHVCEVTALPLINNQEEGREILVVVHDITKQKTKEDALVRALDREKELGDLKSKFVSLASHEFRTPLTTILSSTFLLENYSGEQLKKNKTVHVARIKRAANLLTEILDDFLSLSKLEEEKVAASYAEIDLIKFVQAFVDEAEHQKKEGQVLTFIHEGNPVVQSDKKLLHNILSNLVGNSIKYSGDNGRIAIESSINDSHLLINVRDNGMGIPLQDQKHLFERFYRAQNASHVQGTGLGLNITRKYVQLLNGSISFESDPGTQTVFKVELPLPDVNKNLN